MSNTELSILNDHDNTDCLSRTESSQDLILHLQYNDQREGPERLIKNVRFSRTTTIGDVTRELIKQCRLDNKRPEDIRLFEIIHDNHDQTLIGNAQTTLRELNIEDGCTLCFQPILISSAAECAYLQIISPNSGSMIDFKWYQNSTTLHELLEYVIEKLSLKSIERERIHLFYRFEELDFSANSEKRLKDIGIGNNAYIDVEIIPPIETPISSSNGTTAYDLLTSLDGQDSIHRSTLTTEINGMIVLGIKYMDRSRHLHKKIAYPFLSTATIDEVIMQFLNLTNLNNVRSEDIHFVGFGCNEPLHPVSSAQRYKTLKELNISSGHTLFLEPSTTPIPVKSLSLTIQSLDNNKNVEYKWDKNTTTLGMLLDFVIDEFSLKSIERKRICLETYSGKRLDHTLYSGKLLNDLNISNLSYISMKIMPFDSSLTGEEDCNVHVKCAHKSGEESVNVPHTTTIAELRNQIEKQLKDHLITEMKLFDRMHCTIDMSNQTRKLSDFNVERGHNIYASLELVCSRNPLSKLNMGKDTMTRSSSLIAKPQPDEVTVVCKVSASDSTHVKASKNDTVAELLRRLENFKENRPSAQWDMWCGSDKINIEQPNQILSELGIEAGDTIDATLIEKLPPKYTLESSRGSTSFMLDNSSRSSPIGLSNMGNTCYMNSALQCLAHAKPLTQVFLEELRQNTSDDEKGLETDWNQFYTVGTVIGAYADVLKNLWLPSKSRIVWHSFRPSHIKETIGLQAPRFATYDQQDAQEFLNYLLDEIHKELKEKNGNQSNTIIEELFFGKLQSTVTCEECQHQVKTTNAISFLPLPLNQHGRTFNIKFIARDGENDLTTVCVPENGEVRTIIDTFVDSLPLTRFNRRMTVVTDDGPLDLEMPLNQLFVREVMIIEQDDLSSGYQPSRYGRPSRKLTLDGCLRDFCSVETLEDSWLCQQEACQKQTKATKQLQYLSLPSILIIQLKRFSHENGLRQKIETFVDYPIEGLDLKSLLPSSSSEDAIYDLFAVTNHIGSIYGGHYTAYAQHQSTGRNEWYKFDDSYVVEIYSKDNIVSKDAYLLFYIKRDKSKQTTS